MVKTKRNLLCAFLNHLIKAVFFPEIQILKFVGLLESILDYEKLIHFLRGRRSSEISK